MVNSKLISVLVFGICTISIARTQDWQWQNPLPQGNSLTSVYFPDSNTWYAVGNCCTVLKTTDEGTNWTILESGTTKCLASVYFTDVNICYAVGDAGTIIKTINGGETWTPLFPGTSNSLTTIFFPDVNTGYSVGWS